MGTTNHHIRLRLAVLAAALVAVSLVWSGGTFSSFNRTSSMPGNSVTAGTVDLTDNDAGGAALSTSGLKPGDSTSGCVLVTYAGDPSALVRLYGTVGGTGLAPSLTLTVQRGTFSGTPAAGSCTGFAATATLYNGTLSAFPSSSGSAVADSGTWAGGDRRGYKLTLTLPSGTAASAQGLSATASFTWQAVSQ